MTNQRILSVFLAALMALSVIAAAPAAAVVTLSASGGSATAAPGDTGVQVQFSVTNSGDETGTAEITVDNSSLPSAWDVTDLQATDPNPQDQFAVIDDSPTFVFSDVDAGETVTVTATVDVPNSATPGDYTLNATAEDGNNNQVGTPSATITIPAAGPFEVDNLSPATANATTGSQVQVSADITNTGGVAGDTDVRLLLEGSVVDNTTLTDLAAGASDTAQFTFNAPAQSGTYNWSIETDDDSQSGTLNVTEPVAGPFTIEDAELQPATVAPGGVVVLQANVTNEGEISGTDTIQVSTPWSDSATATRTIDAGATEQVNLALTAPVNEGQYEVTTTTADDTENDTLTVTTLAPYLNEEGAVDINGLLDAIDDWRNGNIGTPTLLDVIQEWRTANP